MNFSNIIGIVLIIVGVISLGYSGINYTKEENVAEIGSLKITSQEQKHIPVPPIVGGICLVGGIALILLGRRR